MPAPGKMKTFKIRVTGTGDYKGNTDIDFVITGGKLSLPAMSYDPRNFKRSSIDSRRRISVNLKGGLPFTWADYTFEPAGTAPASIDMGNGGKDGKSSLTAYDITVPGTNITELTPALTPAVEGDTPPSAVYTLDRLGKLLSESAGFILDADNGKITKNNTSAGA